MASFAEMIYGTASESASANPVNAVVQGAELAMKQEQLQQQRAQLEQRKQELLVSKFNKLGDWFETAQKMPEGKDRQAFVKNYIPQGIQAMGLQNYVNPTSLEMLQGNPTLGTYLVSRVRDGSLDFQALLKNLGDPAALAKLVPDAAAFGSTQELQTVVSQEIGKLSEAEKFRMTEAGKATRAGERTGGIEERAIAGRQERLSNKLVTLGIPALKSSIETLDTVIPGGLKGWKASDGEIPGVTGASAKLPLNQLSEQGRQVRQAALSVGNQIIKLRTGAAMTNDEANRLLGEIGITQAIGEGGGWVATFTGVPSSESFLFGMRNVTKALQKTEQTLARGYKGVKYDEISLPLELREAAPAAPEWQTKLEASKAAFSQLNAAEQKKALDGVAAKYGITVQQAKKALGVK